MTPACYLPIPPTCPLAGDNCAQGYYGVCLAAPSGIGGGDSPDLGRDCSALTSLLQRTVPSLPWDWNVEFRPDCSDSLDYMGGLQFFDRSLRLAPDRLDRRSLLSPDPVFTWCLWTSSATLYEQQVGL